MNVGPKKQYEKKVKRPRIEPAPRDPRIGRIHARIALLRARILKRNLTGGHGDQREGLSEKNGKESTIKYSSMIPRKSKARTAKPGTKTYSKLNTNGSRKSIDLQHLVI